MIEEKLQKCRVELQNMKLKKSGENKFAKFKYYELADFLPAVNKLFADNKMFSNFSIHGDVATLTVTDCEDSSFQTFTSNIADADVKGCTAIQSLGAVHTYLKRYLYLNALEIVENDFLDAKTGSKDFEIEDPDIKYFEQVSKLNTVDELNQFWLKNQTKVRDKERFRDICAGRKEFIMENKNG